MTAYRWTVEPPVSDTALAADLSLGFDNLAEAEDWLAAFCDDLLAAGVARVTLRQGETPVLGPMDLAPTAEAPA
ncbi:MAG: hypothetical protein LBI84_05040 [Propionibacteriaceae bacterium]|nr:hypothetical protein [Propionibacteriaceae bacterium]